VIVIVFELLVNKLPVDFLLLALHIHLFAPTTTTHHTLITTDKHTQQTRKTNQYDQQGKELQNPVHEELPKMMARN